MFAHYFLGAFAIREKCRIRDLMCELLEALAFTFNKKIEVHLVIGAMWERRGPRRLSAYSKSQLSFGAASGFGAAVATSEFLDASGCIDKFLFASEKRMAGGANADFNITPRRTRVINNAARAHDIGLMIFRMNARLHVKNEPQN